VCQFGVVGLVLSDYLHPDQGYFSDILRIHDAADEYCRSTKNNKIVHDMVC
jgi:hypothetical protein